MSTRSRPLRNVFIALAVLALFALLAQPVCEAAEVQNSSCEACCVSVNQGPPPDTLAASAVESPAVVALSPASLVSDPHAARPARARPGPILACPTYHSRSSRNLS